MTNSLTRLTTEQRNIHTSAMDRMKTDKILKIMNQEDQKVAEAVEKVLPEVDRAVTHVIESFKNGGRLFYVGAGTSGRLGILDASECPPTFMAPPDLVQGLMAGGGTAFNRALENSEDDEQQGEIDLKEKRITPHDVVIGITASGRTPYPIGALKYARKVGAYTVSLSCNQDSQISMYADCPIEVIVGPEVLTGSTRLKSGTAHKMILNMISTTSMIKLGKVYENLMVDVHASNYKLKERAKQIIRECTGVSDDEASEVLQKANYLVKPAIVMVKTNASFEEAQKLLENYEGQLRAAIGMSVD